MQPVFPDSPLCRILILGPSGSGKSTVGKRIGRILGIPAIHLDMHYWKPNWVETPKDEWSHLVTPPSYDWRENSISELAAQKYSNFLID